MKISEKAIKELIKLRSEKIKDPTKTLKIVTFPLWQGEGDFGIVIQERFDSDIIIKAVSYTHLTLPTILLV